MKRAPVLLLALLSLGSSLESQPADPVDELEEFTTGPELPLESDPEPSDDLQALESAMDRFLELVQEEVEDHPELFEELAKEAEPLDPELPESAEFHLEPVRDTAEKAEE